jgi:hypothetical protein
VVGARAFVPQALDDAVAAGELRLGTDTVTLTRQVETTITGSLFTWATYREGTAASWIRRDLDMVLATAAGAVVP